MPSDRLRYVRVGYWAEARAHAAIDRVDHRLDAELGSVVHFFISLESALQLFRQSVCFIVQPVHASKHLLLSSLPECIEVLTPLSYHSPLDFMLQDVCS